MKSSYRLSVIVILSMLVSSRVSLAQNFLAGDKWTIRRLRPLASPSRAVIHTPALAEGGIYHSTDKGVTWTAALHGLSGFKINALHIMSAAVFAATGNGLYRIARTMGQPGCARIQALRKRSNAMGHRGDTMYAASNGAGVYRSTNNGFYWEGIGPTGSGIYALSIDVNGSEIYVGTTDYVFKSVMTARAGRGKAMVWGRGMPSMDSHG